MWTGEFNTSVYLAFICEFVYVLVCIVIWFYWGKFPFNLYATSIYVARNFCGCPACASSADVSVRKCHGTLQGRGLLKSHGLSETPIVWRNTSDTFTPRGLGYNRASCELVKCFEFQESDGELRRSCLRRQPACLQPCARLVIACFRARRFRATVLLHLHLCAFLIWLAR